MKTKSDKSTFQYTNAKDPLTEANTHPVETPSTEQCVFCGDCIEVMNGWPESSVDVIVTSPPYNIGIGYKHYDDSRSADEYLSWLSSAGMAMDRILKSEGSLFLNVGGTCRNPWIPADVANVIRNIFRLQNDITWVKSISVADRTHGQFKPINSRRFLNNVTERIFHFTKKGDVSVDRKAIGVPYQDKRNIARFNRKTDRRCAGNIWFIPYETVTSRKGKHNHPAIFPVELPKRCIRMHGVNPNMLVVDPFVGSGSTLVACHQLGVSAWGIDIDNEYCETARARLPHVVDELSEAA